MAIIKNIYYKIILTTNQTECDHCIENSVSIPKLTNQNSSREGTKMASSMLTKQFLGAPFSSFGSGQQPSKLCSSNLRFPTHRSQPKRLEIQAAGNTFGNYFRVTTFGESHGGGVGCIIDGCPPRLPLSESDMQVELDRRCLLVLRFPFVS